MRGKVEDHHFLNARLIGLWVMGASDHRPYRTKEEEKWISECPITCFRKKLIAQYNLKEKEIDNIESGVEEELEQALEFAYSSPDPDFSRVEEAIFCERNNL